MPTTPTGITGTNDNIVLPSGKTVDGVDLKALPATLSTMDDATAAAQTAADAAQADATQALADAATAQGAANSAATSASNAATAAGTAQTAADAAQADATQALADASAASTAAATAQSTASGAASAASSAASAASTAQSTADSAGTAASAAASALTTHTANVSNPHSVTKTQIGLGNVTNDAQIKGTVGTVDNTVPRSDGTGTRDLQASALVIDDLGKASGITFDDPTAAQQPSTKNYADGIALPQFTDSITTTNATAGTIRSVALDDDTHYRFVWIVVVRDTSTHIYTKKVFVEFVRVSGGGAVQVVTDAGPNATDQITVTGATAVANGNAVDFKFGGSGSVHTKGFGKLYFEKTVIAAAT